MVFRQTNIDNEERDRIAVDGCYKLTSIMKLVSLLMVCYKLTSDHEERDRNADANQDAETNRVFERV